MVIARQSLLAKLKSDLSGQFGLWTAMLAFPVVLSASFIVDMRVAEAHRSTIQQALDVTAIAVASNNEITNDQKITMANSIFDKNYSGPLDVDLDILVDEDIIEMNAMAELQTSVRGAIGKDKIEISQISRASMQQKNTICVLALAPDGRDRITFEQGADFDAPTCAVQANSKHSYAMKSSSNHTPRAKSFCSVGGALGRYDPPVKGECNRIADPYVDLDVPQPGSCVSDRLFDRRIRISPQPSGTYSRNPKFRFDESRLESRYPERLLNIPESRNVISRNTVLNPGTFCGGLTINRAGVILRPGTYIIEDGPLTVANRSVLIGRGVTFIMHGRNAVVRIEEGARVNIKAPQKGDLAGIAFMQDAKSLKTESKSEGSSQGYPNGLNLLQSGGALNVIGTLYFPTQVLDISGHSRIGAQSPATSFIAYQVAFAGNTKATVGVDHVKAGLPPLLPIADDAARLLK